MIKIMAQKISAVLLAAIMIFSLCAVTALAAPTEYEDKIISGDLQFTRSLNIMDKNCMPDKPITRIELAKTFYNVLFKNIAEEVNEEYQSEFDDVFGKDAVYAQAVKRLGIMRGVSEQSFSPEGYVTYSQLLKTFVSFLGYDVKANYLGGYPSGYMTVAAQLGLIKNPPASFDYYVTNEKVASMYKLAANVNIMKPVSYGDNMDEYTEREDDTFLTHYLNVQSVKSTVNATYQTNLINDSVLEINHVIIGDELYGIDQNAYGINSLVGYNVTVFYEESGVDKKILCYEENNNTILKIRSSELPDFNALKLRYFNGTKEEQVNINKSASIVYNNTLAKYYNDSILNPFENSTLDGTITLVNNNGDSDYDVVLIEAYETLVVDKVVGSKICPKYRNDKIVDIGDYKNGDDILFRNIKNQPVSLDDIQEDDVLSVYYDHNGKLTKIVVTIDSYIGVLNEISKNGDKYQIKIDDTFFDTSASFILSTEMKKIEIGNKVKALFDRDGLVSDIELLSRGNSVGYVTDISESRGMDKKCSVRIFEADESFSVYELTDTVQVTYGEEELHKTGTEVFDLLGYDGSGRVKRQPVYYSLNDDGKIYQITVCNDTSGPIDGFFRFTDFDASANTPTFRNQARSFQGTLLFARNAFIFNVPEEEDRDDDELYSIRTSYTIENGEYFASNSLKLYGKSKNSRMAYVGVIISGGFENDNITETTAVCAVGSVTKCADNDGEIITKITGMQANKECVFYCNDKLYKEKFANNPLEAGDVIRVTANQKNEIKTIRFAFDESERTLPEYTTNPSSKGYTDPIRYSYGTVTYCDDDMFTIEMLDVPTGKITREHYSLQMKNHNCYKFDESNSKKPILRKADEKEIIDALKYGEDSASKMFIHTYYGDLKTIVLYD